MYVGTGTMTDDFDKESHLLVCLESGLGLYPNISLKLALFLLDSEFRRLLREPFAPERMISVI
jgi:hypothetical protein